MFWFFGYKACGILSAWPGTELTSPTLEGVVLTTGLPEKYPLIVVLILHFPNDV